MRPHPLQIVIMQRPDGGHYVELGEVPEGVPDSVAEILGMELDFPLDRQMEIYLDIPRLKGQLASLFTRVLNKGEALGANGHRGA